MSEIEPLLASVFQQASEAIEYCVSRYTVGIAFGPLDVNVDMASGVALKWRGRRIVATAKHAFPSGSEVQHVTLIFPRDRPLNRGDMAEEIPPLDLGCISHVPKPAVIKCPTEGIDLVFLEITENMCNAGDVDFYELQASARTPSDGTSCVMTGFPNDLSGAISEQEAVVRLANRWSEICNLGDEERFLKEHDRNIHFLMRFHKADRGKRAEGFSGGGIWFALKASSESRLWRPVPGLAGIQSSWFQKSQVTQSVRVEHLVRFLEESLN